MWIQESRYPKPTKLVGFYVIIDMVHTLVYNYKYLVGVAKEA